tara:strand:- start:357 stop:947 length:591 start_codon:yes stop_codon:yes gene_type:complete
MENEQKPTQETHPDASLEKAAGGNEAVTETAVDPLAVINEITGRDYKDLDTAKESIKDWQSEASKAQNLKKEVDTLKNAPKTDEELRALVAQLQGQVNQNTVDTFFAENKDHAANRSLLEKIAKADGSTVADAVNSAEYKSILDAQKTANEVQSKRTVADTNNRVAQPEAQGQEMPKPGDRVAAGAFVANQFFKKD